MLAAVFAIARPDDGLLTPGVCSCVGAVMAVVAVTPTEPRRQAARVAAGIAGQ